MTHDGSSGIHGSDVADEEMLPWKMSGIDRKRWWTECQMLEAKPILIIGNGKFLDYC